MYVCVCMCVYVCVCVCVCVRLCLCVCDTIIFDPIVSKLGTNVGLINLQIKYGDELCGDLETETLVKFSSNYGKLADIIKIINKLVMSHIESIIVAKNKI